jgi:DNA end-binding protein Ku
MRTTWNGSISFGLVSIPVGLAPATASSARQSDVQFKLLHRTCLTPIKQKRWCPFHDVELSADEIVRGWEAAKGQYVPVEDAELEALESYDTSRAIEIKQFVPAGEVDPVYFDRTYFLTPAPAPAARRPYVLLLAAMRETGMGGIGRMVIRGKEYQCLIRPKGDALALETLFLAEDVHSQAEIEEAVADADVRDQELDLARQVIASLADEFDPAALESRYRRDLRALLEAKLEGVEPAKPEPVAEAPVVDLLEALRASVAQASKKKPKAAAGDAAKKAKSSGSGSKTRAATRKSS